MVWRFGGVPIDTQITGRTRGGSVSTVVATSEVHELLDQLTTFEGRQDPYPTYAALRRLAPVARAADGVLVLSRYADCHALLRHPQLGHGDPDAVPIPGLADWRDHTAVRQFRKHLQDDIGDQGPVTQLIERRSDDELLALMSNLGGHDMASMIDAFESIDHDRPVCFIAYTIKGVGLPMQGHKDNHAGLMTVAQMEKWRAAQNIRPGHEWEKFEGLSQDPAILEAFLADAPFNREGRRRLSAPVIDVPSGPPSSRRRRCRRSRALGSS